MSIELLVITHTQTIIDFFYLDLDTNAFKQKFYKFLKNRFIYKEFKCF